MERRSLMLLFMSGLCLLPACSPRHYIVVEEQKSWSEAQSFCRQRYTDLVSVTNQQQSDQLLAAAHKHHHAHLWIGLRDAVHSWRWSLQKEGFYGEGEADYRNTESREFNNYNGHQTCVLMGSGGRWNDVVCSKNKPFICYNDKPGSNSSFVYVDENMKWSEAQVYCRGHYTDLVSVRNQAENEQLRELIQSNHSWIGLHRDSWEWSDGSEYSFMKWNGIFEGPCATLHQGEWNNEDCDRKLSFVCYTDQVQRRTQHVLKLKMIPRDSSVDLEEAADAIVLQLHQKLKKFGLREDVTLTWKKRPDGRIFSLEHKQEETECS